MTKDEEMWAKTLLERVISAENRLAELKRIGLLVHDSGELTDNQARLFTYCGYNVNQMFLIMRSTQDLCKVADEKLAAWIAERKPKT